MAANAERANPGPFGDLRAVEPFWAWWESEGRSLADQGADTGDWRALVDSIGAPLSAVHPHLEWEMGAGDVARHCLTVSGGARSLRPLAERCVRAAPPADSRWEFRPARRPDAAGPPSSITLPDGTPIETGDWSADVHDEGGRISVSLHHPAFASLNRSQRLHACFLMLDRLVGEDAIARWIGDVEPRSKPGSGTGLDVVADAIARRADVQEEPGWNLMDGASRWGKRAVAAVRNPLPWLEHLLLDQRVEVVLPYRTSRRDGLPTHDVLVEMQELQSRVESAIGDRGMLVATATLRRERRLSFYVDHTDAGALEIIRGVARTWPGAGDAVAPDPGWLAMERLAPA